MVALPAELPLLKLMFPLRLSIVVVPAELALLVAAPLRNFSTQTGLPTFAYAGSKATVFGPRNDDCFVAVVFPQHFARMFYGG